MNPSFKFTAIIGLLAALCVGLFGPFAPDVNAAAGLLVATGVSVICAPDFGTMRLFAVSQGTTAPITLLDLAITNGENIAAVVEDVTTVAPELNTVPAIAVDGTSYDILRRTGLPAGGFSQVGGGVAMGKSTWARETKPMFLFQAQMLIGNDIVLSQTARQKVTVGDVLADEAIATVRGSVLNLGQQTYYGLKADANGFVGLNSIVGAADEINNAGANGAVTSAYLCWLDPSEINPQGVHFALGRNGTMDFGEWMQQQVVVSAGPPQKLTTAWVNGMMFFIGFATASAQSVWRVRGIDATHGLTDAIGNAILAKVPIARRSNLRWFMNKTAAYTLQVSRATVSIATGGDKGVSGQGVFPELPTSLAGWPITLTDSLLDTETSAGTLA
jgi:hypothetical protein